MQVVGRKRLCYPSEETITVIRWQQMRQWNAHRATVGHIIESPGVLIGTSNKPSRTLQTRDEVGHQDHVASARWRPINAAQA